MKGFRVTEFRRERGKPVSRVNPVRSEQKGYRVVAPLIKAKGKRGPLAPNTETPYDLIFD
jgi:hypothetical protein